MKKYALFIGRWQTWHKGHQWLINQQLQKGKNVWVAIRDVQVDENNPKTAQQVLKELQLDRNETLEILKKLKEYRYVDEMNDLKYGTYLRFKRISNYHNRNKMHLRILYFIRNFNNFFYQKKNYV